jgi:hypothetical protein
MTPEQQSALKGFAQVVSERYGSELLGVCGFGIERAAIIATIAMWTSPSFCGAPAGAFGTKCFCSSTRATTR